LFCQNLSPVQIKSTLRVNKERKYVSRELRPVYLWPTTFENKEGEKRVTLELHILALQYQTLIKYICLCVYV